MTGNSTGGFAQRTARGLAARPVRAAAAFTLVELMIVVLILGILVGILVPVLGNYMDQARQTKCMTNLRNISTSISNKLEETGGNRVFGLVHGQGDPNALVDNTQVADKMVDFEALAATNAMQNVWMLVHEYQVDWRAFLCPGDGGQTDRQEATNKRYGWTALSEFSYGIQYPYGPFGINDTSLKDRVVVMADRNPGGPVEPTMPHSNHPDAVVVLYYDGNVEAYEAEDSRAGYRGDEIYANKGDADAGVQATAGGQPADRTDTSITPCPSR